MELTDKQADVLRFIEEFQQDQGTCPTLREIQRRFGFASSFAASRHVMALEKKGVLERGDGRARSLVLRRRSPALRIPIFGFIPAGMPVDVQAEADRFLGIDPEALGIPRTARVFGLEVRGDSMIGAHIAHGDLAIVEQKPAAHRDIVAALIDGEVTLKRLIREGAGYFLRAENPAYPDLQPVQEMVIQGVLRCVLRTAPSAL